MAGTIIEDSFSVNVQQASPLSQSECKDAAPWTYDPDSVFVCEYPFDVTVEEGQRLVWVDTQQPQGFYRHTITSVDGLFDQYDAGIMSMLPSAWGGIGTYPFYDKLNPALGDGDISGTITVAAADTTSPTVNVPNNITVSTEDVNGTPIVTYSVSATDDRDVTSGPTCTKSSGSAFSIGTTTVTCTASDAAGNTGTASFTVTVEYTFVDTTPPGFIQPENVAAATTNPAGVTVSYTLPTATDNVGVTSGPTCTPASDSIFSIGTTTVTCTASDATGNVGTTSFDVIVTQTFVDDTAPAL